MAQLRSNSSVPLNMRDAKVEIRLSTEKCVVVPPKEMGQTVYNMPTYNSKRLVARAIGTTIGNDSNRARWAIECARHASIVDAADSIHANTDTQNKTCA